MPTGSSGVISRIITLRMTPCLSYSDISLPNKDCNKDSKFNENDLQVAVTPVKMRKVPTGSSGVIPRIIALRMTPCSSYSDIILSNKDCNKDSNLLKF